jgi:hypothetical protein
VQRSAAGRGAGGPGGGGDLLLPEGDGQSASSQGFLTRSGFICYNTAYYVMSSTDIMDDYIY